METFHYCLTYCWKLWAWKTHTHTVAAEYNGPQNSSIRCCTSLFTFFMLLFTYERKKKFWWIIEKEIDLRKCVLCVRLFCVCVCSARGHEPRETFVSWLLPINTASFSSVGGEVVRTNFVIQQKPINLTPMIRLCLLSVSWKCRPITFFHAKQPKKKNGFWVERRRTGIFWGGFFLLLFDDVVIFKPSSWAAKRRKCIRHQRGIPRRYWDVYYFYYLFFSFLDCDVISILFYVLR